MLTVHLLGQFKLDLNGELLALPSRPAQSLLAWLILHPGIAHRREQIAGIFWPDATEENAQNNLRHALWRLRRAIPEPFVQTDKITIRWVAESDWRLDVADLTASPAAATTADDLIPALHACGGELLPGFYDEWVIRERERLAALYADRIARLLELLLAEERWRETSDWAEQWIAQGSTPEPAYRALMTAHASQGNTAAALAAYQRCVEALERELDAPPSAETEQLHAAIHNSLFTIHHSSFSSPLHPPLRSNLPAATTPLIGRDTELTHLAALLADSAHRLVTILGPGGMGKSRLALAAAHAALDRFPDGVFLVELTPLTSASELARAIGDALRYPFQNDPRPPRQQLTDYLRRRKLLLLLDNFEHLLDGAGLLIALLEAAPDLRLLVTSRERLRLHAETIFRLEGLAYPANGTDGAGENSYGALDLFVTSARRMRHDYIPDNAEWSAVCRVCRLLGGMPLGIVLAAAWIEVLSPQEIAEEIGRTLHFLATELLDLPPRHRQIRSILEYSWRQLRLDEQEALMKLSVFVGSISREAALSVAGASLSALNRLLDLTLIVRAAPGRYSLHEVVRQMASEKLSESSLETDTRSALCVYFSELLHQQTETLVGPQVLRAIKTIETDWPNIRPALGTICDSQDVERLRALLPSLARFLDRPGWWQEGAATFAEIAQSLQEQENVLARKLNAHLLAWQGVFMRSAGVPDRGEAFLQESLAILQGLEKEKEVVDAERAFALLHLHTPLVVGQERRAGKNNYEESLRLFRSLGDRRGEAVALQFLSYMTALADSLPSAQHLAEESLALYEQLNDPAGRAKMLTQLSLVHDYQAHTEEALKLALQAREIAKECGVLDTADDNRLAVAMLHAGRFQEAMQISLASIQAIERIGIETEMLAWRYNTVGRINLHLGEYQAARQQAERANQLFVALRRRQHPFFLRTIGLAFLADGNYPEGAERLAFNLSWQGEVDDTNQLPIASAHVDQCYLDRRMGRPAEMRRHMRTALEIAQRHSTYLVTLRLLPLAALVALDHNHRRLAYDLTALANRYPYIKDSRWYAALALDELNQRLAALPAAERSAAEARGERLELPQLTDELLALL